MNRRWAIRFFWICVLVALGLFLWPVFDPSGLREWVRLSRTEQELQHQIQQTRAQMVQLQELNQRLQRDLTLIERLARENLIYARPNEFVILLREEPDQMSTAPPTEEYHDRYPSQNRPVPEKNQTRPSP